jgi:hypothetical protein
MFLTTKTAFSNWNVVQLRGIYLNSSEQKYNLGDWVFKEGDSSEFVYVIKQGEFILCRDLYNNRNTDKDVFLKS